MSINTDGTGLRTLLETAHGLMCSPLNGPGPRPLARFVDLAIQSVAGSSDPLIRAQLRSAMLADDPNHPVRGYFGHMLRVWDFSSGESWAESTSANTEVRRELIYRLLELDAAEAIRADALIPFADIRNRTIVIAENHQPWYVGERRVPGFYWKAYRGYLKKTGWPDDSLDDLNEASNLVIERISDPLRQECYQTKGLVVGYVQSGKTANFTAVVAKAADAGYRLIVILAGTLNVLRAQTQRRIDKELIGKELIVAGVPEGSVHDYAADRDWPKFIQHNAVPSRLGSFDIERLTGLRDDYRSLRRGIGALEFRGRFDDRPFNYQDNLRSSPVRIVVMKKHPRLIAALRKDLLRLQHTARGDVPALIIDDESDQASVNTAKPDADRKPTNAEIVELLQSLPRAQYIGYTATPFANVFVNPGDPEDLFPKDFFIGLRRPAGYMGVRDFFDFDIEGRSLDGEERPPGFRSNEKAFLRDVREAPSDKGNEDEKDRRELPRALDSFVLSGALKLYREARGVAVSVRHHTMLVHRSTATQVHQADRDLVAECFHDALYGSERANARLKKLWEEDFEPVCNARAAGLPIPMEFSELRHFIEAALTRIRESGLDHGPVRIVNAQPGSAEQAPDFDTENVWAILVGGAKLSRGFTVEGLTVSYFRRRIRTGDTLMQTGRWFGFRRGYHDLVRVFLGRDEPDGPSSRFDLQEAFKAICMDEEMFRGELQRYMERRSDGALITPKQVPPLVPQHLLAPTAKNKMFNAKISFKNFGGRESEETQLPPPGQKGAAARNANASAVRAMLERTTLAIKDLGAMDTEGREYRWDGYVAEVEPREFLQLLNKLQWAEKAPAYRLEREFLAGKGNFDPEIDRWIVIFPQRGDSEDAVWECGHPLKVVKRSRTTRDGGNQPFKVFSEPRHRAVAEVVMRNLGGAGATADTLSLRRSRTAVALVYPTLEELPPTARPIADEEISIGFWLGFPINAVKEQLVFGVRDSSKPDAITVTGTVGA
jgi:Z1 domain